MLVKLSRLYLPDAIDPDKLNPDKTVGENSLPGHDPVILVKRPVQTRMHDVMCG